MTKKTLIPLLCLFSLHAFSGQGQLTIRPKSSVKILKCLGLEEASYHEKHQAGVFYKLNQKLIGELILLGSVDVKDEYLKSICYSKVSPAFELLRYIVKKEKALFTYRTNDPLKKQMAASNTDEFLERLPEVISTFISAIQANAPTADCLEKHLPGLNQMNYELKYLEAETDRKSIFTPKKLNLIFRGINNISSIFKRCEQDKKRAEQKTSSKK